VSNNLSDKLPSHLTVRHNRSTKTMSRHRPLPSIDSFDAGGRQRLGKLRRGKLAATGKWADFAGFSYTFSFSAMAQGVTNPLIR
jgi:hypothetical protein